MNIFRTINNKSDWEQLLSQASFHTFFHNPLWEAHLENTFSWMRFEHYVWRDQALLSVARCRYLGKEKVVSHPFCEYGGAATNRQGI